MPEKPDRAIEGIPGRAEDAPEQGAEGGGGLRAVGVIVAVVSASALVGGGAGMLAGVALGAINPFALGIIGSAVGAGAPVLIAAVTRGSWRRRVGG